MIRRTGSAVVELCIDAPASRNALGVAALEALDEAFDDIAADRSVRVVVLTAAGKVFSSGADRADLADPTMVARSSVLLRRIIEKITELDQPVVCRVNGDAYGGAVAIIAAADLTLAAETAHIALPEARFGLVATVAAGACARRIGLSAALDILLTGRRVPASEAVQRGLFSAAVSIDKLDSAVAERVDELLLGGPRALSVTKRMVRALCGPSAGNDLLLASAIGSAVSAAEAAAGVTAMTERRPADWVTTWDRTALSADAV